MLLAKSLSGGTERVVVLPPQAVLQGPGPGLQLQLPEGAEPWVLRDRGGLRGPIALLRCPPHTLHKAPQRRWLKRTWSFFATCGPSARSPQGQRSWALLCLAGSSCAKSFAEVWAPRPLRAFAEVRGAMPEDLARVRLPCRPHPFEALRPQPFEALRCSSATSIQLGIGQHVGAVQAA